MTERAVTRDDTQRRPSASCRGIGIAWCPADPVPRPGRPRCTRPARTSLRSWSSLPPRSRDIAGKHPASVARTWPAGPAAGHHRHSRVSRPGPPCDARSRYDRVSPPAWNRPSTAAPGPVPGTRARRRNRPRSPPGTRAWRGPGPTPESPVRPVRRHAAHGASASAPRRPPEPCRHPLPAANRRAR